ncbi:hypothetical protein [Lactiplantibacillus carotarum]|uniref:hypothetical protein n=1 Tax=Lactiplantibacillus carotarum TaxID=2993456 RepID=UPI00298F279F|nr:hypothetical protein [Lactiplantibacillus carotarum]
MTTTQLLAQYTFEPVTTSTKFDQRTLTVKDQDRTIPFGHFKLRLKNIDNQQHYDLELHQQLQLTTTAGFQLRSRLHGIRVQHGTGTNRYQVHATLTLHDVPAMLGTVTQRHPFSDSVIHLEHHVVQTLPANVPLYAFTDNHELVLNQAALAQLVLTGMQSSAPSTSR